MMTRQEALVDLAIKNLATTRRLATKGVLTFRDVIAAKAELQQYKNMGPEPRTVSRA
jgi:hypothetical protein